MEQSFKLYTIEKDLRLLEIARKEINKKTYLFMVRENYKDDVVIGFLDKNLLKFVKNKLMHEEIVKNFLDDKKCYARIKPFLV